MPHPQSLETRLSRIPSRILRIDLLVLHKGFEKIIN